MRRLVILMCIVVLPSCAHFSPPSQALLAQLGDHLPAEQSGVRRQVMLDIASPTLNGTFEGILVATREAEPSIRMQLFPGVGGKVLDLGASPEAITVIPHDGDVFHTQLPTAKPIKPTLGFLFAATLVEHFSGFDPSRVTGVRPWGNGWELRLEPGNSGVEVRWFVTSEFQIEAREYRYGRARWRETGDEELRVKAWRTEAILETMEEELDDDLPRELFSVPVPALTDGAAS